MTYVTQKKLYISLFLLRILGPIYHGIAGFSPQDLPTMVNALQFSALRERCIQCFLPRAVPGSGGGVFLVSGGPGTKPVNPVLYQVPGELLTMGNTRVLVVRCTYCGEIRKQNPPTCRKFYAERWRYEASFHENKERCSKNADCRRLAVLLAARYVRVNVFIIIMLAIRQCVVLL